MLIFYYGLLFLETLSISDGVATFLVIALVDFLLLKAIWENYKPIMPWRKLIKEQTKEWREWWKHLSGLKKIYFVLAVIVSPIFIGSFVLIFPQFIIKINAPSTTFYNLSLAVFACLSGIGAVFGFYTSTIRTETAEQGLITDRLNKATEGLGKKDDKGEPIVEVRLGALYALERIAQDSARDHIQITEILCAYIRYNSPWSIATGKVKKVRADVHAAITIIGRRGLSRGGVKDLVNESKKGYFLDLRQSNLCGAYLAGATLINAWLNNANLQKSVLIRATLNQAHMNGADLTDAILTNANFQGVYTKEIFAWRGDFSECMNLTQKQIDVMYCGIEVKISKDLTRPKHWPTANLSYIDFMKLCVKWRHAQL